MRRLVSLWRNLVRRGRTERALDDEVRGAFDLIVERKAREGLTPDEARRAAALEFGGVEAVKQEVREVRSGAALESLLQDVRYAWRALRRTPLFLVAAAGSLAVGLAGNVVVFSLVDAWLVRQRPGPVATDRLVEVGRIDSGGALGRYTGEGFDTFSWPTYVDARARQTVFEGFAAYDSGATFGFGGDEGAVKVTGTFVSANYFDVLGVRMIRGRGFLPDEDQPASPREVVVISEALWRREFAAATDIVGRSVRLNGRPFTIVGVAPAAFGGTSIDASNLWVPIPVRDAGDPSRVNLRGRQWLMGIARLRPGVTFEQARADLARVASTLQRDYPGDYVRHGLGVEALGPLPVAVRPFVGRYLGLLLAFVGLVLLIACFNVAGLLLARGASRAEEIGVRLALGGPRSRVVRLLVIESLIVAILGAVAGLVFARAAIAGLLQVIPPLRFEVAFDIALTGRVMAVALLVAVACGLVGGIAPARAATRIDLASTIVRAGGATRRLRGRSLFVTMQVALSALLVVCALLLGRSLRHAAAIDPGFAFGDVEAMSIDVRLAGYDEARGAVFMKELTARLDALPGIRGSALARVAPLTGEREGGRAWLPGEHGDAQAIDASQNIVSPGYFRALGLPILAGRNFTEADGPTAPSVALVNETLAKHAWPGQSPVGKRIEVGRSRHSIEIIGVVRDAKYRTIGEAPTPFFYVSSVQRYESIMWVLWRPEAGSAMTTVRAALRALDPNVPTMQAGRLEELSAFLLFPSRMAAWLAAIVGVVGVLLAAVGVFGVAACDAVQRRREIGIRLALGGERSVVLHTIMRHAMRLALAGAALGLLTATLAGRLLEGLLYDMRGIDPLSFTGAAFIVLATTFVASLIPAARAASISPVDALRRE